MTAPSPLRPVRAGFSRNLELGGARRAGISVRVRPGRDDETTMVSRFCGRLAVTRKQQSRGYAVEIVDLGNRFCFSILKAHRAWGVVHQDNPAAKQVLLNAGMTYEERIRDFFYARGAWHNVDSYSILEGELPPPAGERSLCDPARTP